MGRSEGSRASITKAGIPLAVQPVIMSLSLRITTPPPPAAPYDEYEGLEDLDRAELDDMPETERDGAATLASLDWDDDGESGVKRRGGVADSNAS